jgi:hypothetical protein
MARPDPIQYAERLYGAIRAANFSPISFLAFGNAIKDGVPMRNMPRIAAEPFMRVVGEMLDLEEEMDDGEILEVAVASESSPRAQETAVPAAIIAVAPERIEAAPTIEPATASGATAALPDKRRGRRSGADT